MTGQKQPTPMAAISDIQLKADGSFVVLYNGYPFHATQNDTPQVYAEVVKAVEAGAECGAYVEPSVPGEALEQAERIWRDAEIERVSWLRDRHRDELETGRAASITLDQYVAVLDYLHRLRDWPQTDAFPEAAQRPAPPPWIADLTS